MGMALGRDRLGEPHGMDKIGTLLGTAVAGAAAAILAKRISRPNSGARPDLGGRHSLGQFMYETENALDRARRAYNEAVSRRDPASIERTYSDYRSAYERQVSETPVRDRLERLLEDFRSRTAPGDEASRRSLEAEMERLWPGWFKSRLDWEIYGLTGGKPAWYRSLEEAGAGAANIALQLLPFARGVRLQTRPASGAFRPPVATRAAARLQPATARVPVAQPPVFATAPTVPAAAPGAPSPSRPPSFWPAGPPVPAPSLPTGGYIRGAAPGARPTDPQIGYLSNAYDASRTSAEAAARTESRIAVASQAARQYRHLTDDAQFRVAMRAVHDASDEPTRAAISREMARWNATGRVSSELQRIWERATGTRVPAPVAPPPSSPIPTVPAGRAPEAGYIPAPPGVVIPPTVTARRNVRTGELTYPRAVVEYYTATQVTPLPGTIPAVRLPVPTVPAAPPPVVPAPTLPPTPTGYVPPLLPFGFPLATAAIPFGLGRRIPLVRV